MLPLFLVFTTCIKDVQYCLLQRLDHPDSALNHTQDKLYPVQLTTVYKHDGTKYCIPNVHLATCKPQTAKSR